MKKKEWKKEAKKRKTQAIELAVKNVKLEKDALRYRKLRDMHWSCDRICVVEHPKKCVQVGSHCPSREALDELLDSLPHPVYLEKEVQEPAAVQEEPVFHLRAYGDVTKEQLDEYVKQALTTESDDNLGVSDE